MITVVRGWDPKLSALELRARHNKINFLVRYSFSFNRSASCRPFVRVWIFHVLFAPAGTPIPLQKGGRKRSPPWFRSGTETPRSAASPRRRHRRFFPQHYFGDAPIGSPPRETSGGSGGRPDPCRCATTPPSEIATPRFGKQQRQQEQEQERYEERYEERRQQRRRVVECCGLFGGRGRRRQRSSLGVLQVLRGGVRPRQAGGLGLRTRADFRGNGQVSVCRSEQVQLVQGWVFEEKFLCVWGRMRPKTIFGDVLVPCKCAFGGAGRDKSFPEKAGDCRNLFFSRILFRINCQIPALGVNDFAFFFVFFLSSFNGPVLAFLPSVLLYLVRVPRPSLVLVNFSRVSPERVAG